MDEDANELISTKVIPENKEKSNWYLESVIHFNLLIIEI